MSYPNLANGWTSTLTSGISSGATSADVSDATGMPAFPFQAVIAAHFPDGTADGANSDEIVTVTGLSTLTAAITRHTEANSAGSSTGSAHSSGVVISHVLTAGALADAVGSAGGGALVLLEQHTGSSSASLNFTTAISSSYDDYLVEFINVMPATDGANLKMRVSTNGGSTYDSSSIYAWYGTYNGMGDAGTIGNADTDTSFGPFGNPKNTAAAGGLTGSMHLFSPGSTTAYKTIITDTLYPAGDGRQYHGLGNGRYASTTAVDAFQFYFSSGNIGSGTIRVYGYAK